VRRFLEEVPALEPIKLVVAVELRGRGDVQHFRLEMPGVKVTKTPPTDARMRVEMRREFFNVMAKEGKVPDWVEAFTYGQAKATGPEQFMKLISNVVEKQQERERTRRARKHDE
jgi:2-methylisocitrate lyase-like PEP mutase family enzyme